MRKPVTLGIVGVGFGQAVHAPAFRDDPRCVVAGICARRFERAQQAARALGGARAYRDAQEMIDDPAIDAISIAAPPEVQAAVACAAARAGKHLFCEKPVAPSARQAADLLAAAESGRIVHAVDFEFPELDAWRQARGILQGGGLGRIRHVVLNWRVETAVHRGPTESWKGLAAAGGGVLNNFASHGFHYLEWLFGPVARLAARLRPGIPAPEARADLWFEFEQGFPGTAVVSADAFLGPGHCLEVYGDAGSLVLENRTADYLRGFVLRHATRTGGALVEVPVEQDTSARDGRILPVGRIARRFLDAIGTGGRVSPNLCDGLRVQALIDAARGADREGGWRATPLRG